MSFLKRVKNHKFLDLWELFLTMGQFLEIKQGITFKALSCNFSSSISTTILTRGSRWVSAVIFDSFFSHSPHPPSGNPSSYIQNPTLQISVTTLIARLECSSSLLTCPSASTLTPGLFSTQQPEGSFLAERHYRIEFNYTDSTTKHVGYTSWICRSLVVQT